MTEKQMPEATNPHDKIFIDCSDVDAAQLAVFGLGMGKYGIADCMPILLYGRDITEWVEKEKGGTFEEWAETVSPLRFAQALESMAIEGERTSLMDVVGKAHGWADDIRGHNGLGAKDE